MPQGALATSIPYTVWSIQYSITISLVSESHCVIRMGGTAAALLLLSLLYPAQSAPTDLMWVTWSKVRHVFPCVLFCLFVSSCVFLCLHVSSVYSSVLLCLPISSCVFLYLQVTSWVFWCIWLLYFVFLFFMCTCEILCLPLYSCIFLCVNVFSWLFLYLHLSSFYSSVLLCLPNSLGVFLCFQSIGPLGRCFL